MISRRRFLQSTASIALLPLVPGLVRSADSSLRIRPSWPTFCTSPSFASFVDAVGKMRANRDTTSPLSWGYWVHVHENFCPHGKPYFLAWHRGFIYSFESCLREVSGDSSLVLPYWDYYTDPKVPQEFLDTSSPLWRKERTGDDVSGALSLDPFADTVTNFKRGAVNAFETALETQPHNPVHNLIGGAMGDVAISPRDPLFWVHHANIDRLWLAWVMAGDGRRMPSWYKPYWQGDFGYGDAMPTIPRVWTRVPSNHLQYAYDDQNMPSAIPVPEPPPASSTPSTPTASTLSSLARIGALPLKPASAGGTSLGASMPFVLDERSVSVDVALSGQDANRVRSLLLEPQAATSSSPDPLRLVLDGVRLTALGSKGGHFYKIYVNLPDRAGLNQPERTYLLGMIGAFEIGVAQMRVAMQGKGMQAMRAGQPKPDVQFVFPLTEALKRIWPTQLDTLSISFVRVDGRSHPKKGDTIKVRDLRVEAAT